MGHDRRRRRRRRPGRDRERPAVVVAVAVAVAVAAAAAAAACRLGAQVLPDLHVFYVLDVIRLGQRPQAQPESRVVASILELVAEMGQRQKNQTRSVSALRGR